MGVHGSPIVLVGDSITMRGFHCYRYDGKRVCVGGKLLSLVW